jgi:phage terminase large subunit
MPNEIRLSMPEPNEKQKLAFLDDHRYLAYGGARGGGKSWFVRWKATLLCLKYPGIKILITRRTYKELLNNHIVPLLTMLHGIAVYNRSDKCFKFPNGSTIWFGYCANDGDLGQYQGAEYDVWFADEAGQFQESWLTNIDACVRGANDFPKRTIYTLNPGGPSHGYFKRIFLDKRYTEDEYPEDYAFIQAKVKDNKALMKMQPKYLRSLEKLAPKLRAAWLEGSWDIYEGQFFEDFYDKPDHYADRQFTHVIDPFEIPA